MAFACTVSGSSDRLWLLPELLRGYLAVATFIVLDLKKHTTGFTSQTRSPGQNLCLLLLIPWSSPALRSAP